MISNFGAVYFSGQYEEFSPLQAMTILGGELGSADDLDLPVVCTPPHSHSCSSQSNPTSGPVFVHVCVCVRVYVCVLVCLCVLVCSCTLTGVEVKLIVLLGENIMS